MKTINSAPVSQLSKIQKVALRSIYNADQMNALEEILSATPNPEVAIELLLNVYEQPEINEVDSLNEPSQLDRTFVSYDKFRDEVTYSYIYAKTKHCWFAQDETEFTVEKSVAEGTWLSDVVSDYNKRNHTDYSIDEFRKLFVRKEIVSEITTDVRQAVVVRNKWNNG